MMPYDSREEITTARWNVLRSWWKDDDLTTVLGGAPLGYRSWHEVDMEDVHSRPLEQEVPVHIRKQQVAPLRYFMHSMLNQVGFHTARPTELEKFDKTNKPFSVSVVSEKRIP
ncbi:hypothetical protein Ddye_004829 [Dipteronia dyeriana]|uniref:Uncharacterized protein n=1 Tax=Dipteronia dyeriana TaxID=168575 RepID=A0AAD9XFK6_9ROSI|nr:hypothetical protein Ddye_004829 [Dipteronia dyeriana]